MSIEVFSYQVDAPYDEEIQYNVAVSNTEGGREYRYQKWLYPKRIFSITLRARNRNDTNNIWNFYQRHTGILDSFLYENPNDSSSSDPITEDVFATGDGVETTFYIGNKFNLPTGDCYLLSGTVTIQQSLDGTGDYVTKTDSVDFNLTESIGQVIWIGGALPDDDTLRATYRFYYTVRFKEPRLTRKAFAYQLWDYGLELIQVI